MLVLVWYSVLGRCNLAGHVEVKKLESQDHFTLKFDHFNIISIIAYSAVR